jgi:predicted ATP-dependent endonuclease of OLD family
MRLVSARVTNYKSIDDSTKVEMDNVTCLVGKNEAGKTAFLKALQKLSTVDDEDGTFDPLVEYPKKSYSRYKRLHDATPAEVVQVEFELSDGEIARIESSFGEGVLKSRTVQATKNYKNQRSLILQVDESAVVDHFTGSAGLPDDLKKQVGAATTVDELVSLLEAVEDAPPSATTLLEVVTNRFGASTVSHQIINDYLVKLVPRFVYFDDYSIMGGRISIQDLRQRRDNGNLKEADRTFLALLSLVGASLDDFENEQNYTRLKAELEAASNRISDEVFAFWSQNKELEVNFDIFPANPADLPPLNSGTILSVWIRNTHHRVSVPFDERSRGFVWFFSFLVYFSQLEDRGTDLLLLLDEPGLSLHAKAQGDFLRFIDERLAPKHQVIYTTHSPFMINPYQLQRARTVQDLDSRGTIISRDVLSSDRDTVYPLQAAMGYEMAQTLFIGPHNLLVEGPSDLIYLQVLSSAATSRGKVGLDPRWVVIPVGGAAKLSTFVTLYGGNKLDIAVLMDTSPKEQQTVQNLIANSLLKGSNLVQVNEITNTSSADIEDIFDANFYLKLVNGAYKGVLPKAITQKALPASNSPIVKRVEVYLRNEGHDGIGFDHYTPATYLLREQGTLLQDLDDATVDRAVQLFERLNALLPSASGQAPARPT